MRALTRRLAAVAIAVAAVAAPLGANPTEASAATWTPCTFAVVAIDCATYELPLDRTGAVPGTVKVRAMRMAAPEGPRMGTLFVLAGGPGQGSTSMVELMSTLFGGANRYDIVAIDQRGSGTSEPLNCPRIESGSFNFVGDEPKTDWPITQCSNSLGAARYSFNTAEAVADVEAVRADLGVGPVSMFGVSYGTKLAMAYAKTYPANTRALLLDSLVPVDEPSSFDTDSLVALRRALAEICASRRCRGINKAPVSGLARIARRLARAPLPAFSITATGRIKQTQIDDEALLQVVLQADFNLFVFNQLPSAITTALRGDYAQIARLYAIVTGAYRVEMSRRKARAVARRIPKRAKKVERKSGKRLRGRDAEMLAEFSNTMNLATNCADLDPPWARGADLAGRQDALVGAANAIPNADFNPFSRSAVRNASLAAMCRGWQQSATAPALPAGPLPAVPTLALNGSLDLRTPNAWAERSVAGNPTAELSLIQATGHSVIGTDASGCALSLAKRFLIYGATDGKCNRKPPALPVAPVPATSLNKLTTPRGTCRGLRGRRCAAAKREVVAGYLAMRDSLDQLILGNMLEGPGLYGGLWFLDFDISDDLVELLPVNVSLLGVANTPDSSVSGSVNLDSLPTIGGKLRVSGNSGREFRVSVSGRIAYNRVDDRLTLSARRGKQRVTIRLRGRGRSARAASSYAATRAGLRLRVNYSRAVGLAPAGTFGR